MKHPSIRLRLIIGTGLSAAAVMALANVLIYRGIERTLRKEVRVQIYQSASLLAKSSELEPDGVVYEWKEALDSMGGPSVVGLFQFWDEKTKVSARSPSLGQGDLPYFHGRLDQPVMREIKLDDGRPALAVGLRHLPFLDEESVNSMKRAGRVLERADFPQVLVVARETQSLHDRMERFAGHLVKAGMAEVGVIWLTLWGIATLTMRPIRDLTATLLRRSAEEGTPLPGVPPGLPRELIGLAGAFDTALGRVEAARARERDFALRAAHELRTPVAGIGAILEQALHRPREAADLRERIGRALDVARGMGVSVNGLMRLARLRGGLDPVAAEAFDPVASLRELWDLSAPLAAERGLEWRWESGARDMQAIGDPGLFRTLAGNLVENAARHTPAGGRAEMRIEAAAGEFLFAITNDRGALRPEDAERIFEPFARGASGSQEPGHAGLGLSLAREVAALLGGRLGVDFGSDGTVTFSAAIPWR